MTVGADQVELIAKAMTAAGTTEGSAVNTALSSLDYAGAQAEYKFQPGHTFGSSNPYVLASAKGSDFTVVYQPMGAA